MGIGESKGQTQEFKEAERKHIYMLQKCMEQHRSNVYVLDSVIATQTSSVEQLVKLLSDNSGMEHTLLDQELRRTSRELLDNIQRTLVLQSDSLKGSCSVLIDCLHGIIDFYKPDHGSTQNQNEASVVTTKHFQTHSEINIRDSGVRSNDLCSFSDNVINPSDGKGSPVDSTERNVDFRVVQDENKRLVEDNRRLQKEIKEQNGTIEQMQREIDGCRQDLEYKITCLQNVIRTKDSNFRESENKRSELEKTNTNLKWRMQDFERKVKGMENKEAMMKQRKITITVQLYFQRRGDLMSAVVDELTAMLNTQMCAGNVELDIIRCERDTDIHTDKPLLVLCINASRLGTDAANAILGIRQPGHTALLIFHHKNVHALPNQPSDRVLTGPEFKALGGIIDMAFLTGKGIYPCDMNNFAVNEIVSFIKQRMVGKS